jgi:hypothetical protein
VYYLLCARKQPSNFRANIVSVYTYVHIQIYIDYIYIYIYIYIAFVQANRIVISMSLYARYTEILKPAMIVCEN